MSSVLDTGSYNASFLNLSGKRATLEDKMC